MIKKIIAVALAALFCLCAVGCAEVDPNAPEGMKSVTVAGQPFTLYVPNAWTDNISSGTSGAYYSAVKGLSVSARFIDTDKSAEEYLNECTVSLGAEYADKSFEADAISETVLGGKDARRLVCRFDTENGKTVYTVTATAHDGGIVALYFLCPVAEAEARAEVLDSIRSAFVLGERGDDGTGEVEDKNAPEGMKRASAKNLEYRFYVPKDWVCDAEVGITDAYHPTDKTNISMTSFIPDSSMSVAEYFALCEAEYMAELDGYARVGEPTTREVFKRTATTFVYTFEAEGISFKVSQTVFVYDSAFYTVTYTARSEYFDAHLAERDTMLDAVKFR